jgi:RND family efflux transporter MFP subunit
MPTSQKGPAIADKDTTQIAGSAAPNTETHPVPALRALATTPSHVVPKPGRRLWVWGVGGLLAAGLGLGLYFQPWAAKTTLVVTEIVALAPVTRILAVNGRIEALRSVDLRPLVSGTLAAVVVAEGDVVASGADLAQIDQATQQAVVRQAKAGLDAALVAQDDAKAIYDRTKALGANAARTVLEDAARAMQSAAQEVVRTTALFDQAQIQLGHFTIRAPMAGTILVLNVDPGQAVDTSTILLTLADLGALVVETDVDEAYATQIRLGQPAALQLAGETTVRDGRVSFVSQRVDEATGGLAVKLAFDVPVTAPIGLTVTANIVVDNRPAALTVPRAAIMTGAQGMAVFVMADGLAQQRPIAVIDWPAARLIVTDGLAPGDVLIADAAGLVDGQAVKGQP